MKIAFVNKFFFLKGGQETLMFEEANLLTQQGHEVVFFSMTHPENIPDYEYKKYFISYMELSNSGKEYNFLEKLKLAGKFIYNYEAKKKFEAFIADTKPDIIHCHGIAHQITYSVLPVAKKYKIPVVQTLHDYQLSCPCYTLLKAGQSICDINNCADTFYIQCIINKCVKKSFSASVISALEMNFNLKIMHYSNLIDKFISPSTFLKDLTISKGFDKTKFVHIPNFINDIDKIYPNYNNENYFLFFGRLSYEKGLFTLLETFKNLPNANLKIVGTGPLLPELTAYQDDSAIKNVEFLGFKTGDDLDNAIKGSIAVILPAEWYENAPMSIIEAFARGKSVIAANLGGIPEMVKSFETGFTFEHGNSKDLKLCLESYIEDPSLSSKLGKQARHFAISNYNSDIHIEKLLKVYENLKKT